MSGEVSWGGRLRSGTRRRRVVPLPTTRVDPGTGAREVLVLFHDLFILLHHVPDVFAPVVHHGEFMAAL